jgi:peptide/nickel transport system ATP-binding protein
MDALASTSPVLQVEDLTVAYQQGQTWLDAVRDFSLRIEPGQTVGLVGESGSGKTTIAMAIMHYLGEQGRVVKGRIVLDGRDVLDLSEDQMRRVWGVQMSLVPQNPLSSLNPSIRIGEQLGEGLRFHEGLDRAAAEARVIQLLRMVRLPEPEVVANSYPHQISGGMQQRVMIAMALSTAPRLLILDEPTTNLDVTTQASILDLFRDLIQGLQSAVLYVTHNLGVVAQICDRVAVLYAGELVEDAPVEDLFRQPLHPYTRGLLDSVPKLGQNKNQVQLQSIQGQIPPIGARPSGCVFIDRCPLAIELCQERPPLFNTNSGRSTRCHRWEELAGGKVSAGQPSQFTVPHSNGREESLEKKTRPPVLSLDGLKVYFEIRRSLGQVLAGEPARQVKAVDGIDLFIPAGKTIGMVGESGSGKTTLARAIVGLVERTDGEIELLGLPLPPTLSRRGLETLKHVQMVFQNPEEALNPYLSVGASLRRPLMTLMQKSRREADAEVQKLLAAVRLPGDYARRMPGQLSGGEKQRVAIARAFASSPDLLLADEPVSSLDVSVQATILNLLNHLQAEQSSTMLFISHDLAVVGYLADEIAVIYLGHIMEMTRAENLFEPPCHPYTEALLSAIPMPDPGARRENIRLEGDIPSPAVGLTGCPFHTRCPRSLGDICAQVEPPWRVDERTGKRYFCHIPLEELLSLQTGATGKH